MITASTRTAGVFGWPIGHSLSPEMQNAAFRAAGLPVVYLAFEVHPALLATALAGAAAMGMVGVNLTVPHKVAAAPLMARLSPEAAALGAVNTVRFTDDGMEGHNTDVEGFLQAVREQDLDPRGAQAVVYGAGGAARAVVYGLARSGAHVCVVNRTPARAAELQKALQASVPVASVSVAEPGSDAEAAALRSAALVVNATSAGMSPHTDTMPPVALEHMPESALVMDLVYRPSETIFLRRAREAGCRTVNGVPMLVHQGAVSFRLWLGQEPDIQAMRVAVEEALLRETEETPLAGRQAV